MDNWVRSRGDGKGITEEQIALLQKLLCGFEEIDIDRHERVVRLVSLLGPCSEQAPGRL